MIILIHFTTKKLCKRLASSVSTPERTQSEIEHVEGEHFLSRLVSSNGGRVIFLSKLIRLLGCLAVLGLTIFTTVSFRHKLAADNDDHTDIAFLGYRGLNTLAPCVTIVCFPSSALLTQVKPRTGLYRWSIPPIAPLTPNHAHLCQSCNPPKHSSFSSFPRIRLQRYLSLSYTLPLPTRPTDRRMVHLA